MDDKYFEFHTVDPKTLPSYKIEQYFNQLGYDKLYFNEKAKSFSKQEQDSDEFKKAFIKDFSNTLRTYSKTFEIPLKNKLNQTQDQLNQKLFNLIYEMRNASPKVKRDYFFEKEDGVLDPSIVLDNLEGMVNKYQKDSSFIELLMNEFSNFFISNLLNEKKDDLQKEPIAYLFQYLKEYSKLAFSEEKVGLDVMNKLNQAIEKIDLVLNETTIKNAFNLYYLEKISNTTSMDDIFEASPISKKIVAMREIYITSNNNNKNNFKN